MSADYPSKHDLSATLKEYAELTVSLRDAEKERKKLQNSYDEARSKHGDIINTEGATDIWNAFTPLLDFNEELQKKIASKAQAREKLKKYFRAFPTESIPVKVGSEDFLVRMLGGEISIAPQKVISSATSKRQMNTDVHINRT